MKRVLLVDASVDVRDQLTKAVGSDYELLFGSSVNEAKTLLEQEAVDLIVMESCLPDGSGFSLCSEIKTNEVLGVIPIIFLTEKAQLADRIAGFRAGADDYVIKPFDSVEMNLRIGAKLRKSGFSPKSDSVVQRGDLTLAVPFQKATLRESAASDQAGGGGEKDLKLTPTEFRLLYFFIRNEGTILSRDQLLTTVWNGDAQVLARTIDKHISTLKKKLGARAAYIQSIHSKGYRFSISNLEPAQEDSVLFTGP